MSYALTTTALLMGLAGGPHCAVMCGAACGGLARMPLAEARKQFKYHTLQRAADSPLTT